MYNLCAIIIYYAIIYYDIIYYAIIIYCAIIIYYVRTILGQRPYLSKSYYKTTCQIRYFAN